LVSGWRDTWGRQTAGRCSGYGWQDRGPSVNRFRLAGQCSVLLERCAPDLVHPTVFFLPCCEGGKVGVLPLAMLLTWLSLEVGDMRAKRAPVADGKVAEPVA